MTRLGYNKKQFTKPMLLKKKISKIFKSKDIGTTTVKKKQIARKTRRQPKKSRPSIKKVINNPIISPKRGSSWESWQTFNPAAILIEGKVHFLYRAIGNDGISRFGYANSKDGFKLDERHPAPAYQDLAIRAGDYNYPLVPGASGGSWGGCEDPRMVRIDEDDKIYITYTSCSGGLRVGLSSIKVDDFLNKKWNWSSPKLISPPGEVHKNWVIFPEKINGKYAILHSISPKISIAYVDNLDFKEGEYIQSDYHPGTPSENWDSYLRGPGPTPIKTRYGWLLFYHAMNHQDMGQYNVGAMLLDLKDPTKILYRSQKPILVPDEYYETSGFKPGVVYVLGAVVKEDNLILYYGGADSYVCAAYANLDEFLKELTKETKKPLIKRLLKTKK